MDLIKIEYFDDPFVIILDKRVISAGPDIGKTPKSKVNSKPQGNWTGILPSE
jgi:hypothetical protein